VPFSGTDGISRYQFLRKDGRRPDWDRDRVLMLARFLIAVAITFFGAEQVLHPEFAPGLVDTLWLSGSLPSLAGALNAD
jgi:hypothetical protein